jgi:hypothetical protein
MKKLVIYDPASVVGDIVVGVPALVKPINHPDKANVSNTKLVATSNVVALGLYGIFETENTRYVPETRVDVKPAQS